MYSGNDSLLLLIDSLHICLLVYVVKCMSYFYFVSIVCLYLFIFHVSLNFLYIFRFFLNWSLLYGHQFIWLFQNEILSTVSGIICFYFSF